MKKARNLLEEEAVLFSFSDLPSDVCRGSAAEDKFIVATANSTIRVYAASSSALLHEFAIIHSTVEAVHYTNFSDSIITLEEDEEENQFLCVYHDWRHTPTDQQDEIDSNKLRRVVRGYTLPLPPAEKNRLSLAVCCYSGRVAVAVNDKVNIWQCSDGFFEHVMELIIQQHSPEQESFKISKVTISGMYVCVANETEIRLMRIVVHNNNSSNDDTPCQHYTRNSSTSHKFSENIFKPSDSEFLDYPSDSEDYQSFDASTDYPPMLNIPMFNHSTRKINKSRSSSSLNNGNDDSDSLKPIIFDGDRVQEEVSNLAGLIIQKEDIRVNKALGYHLSSCSVLLRRYLPLNHTVQSLMFLPETITNCVSKSSENENEEEYIRLLIGTSKIALLYYFLSKREDGNFENQEVSTLCNDICGPPIINVGKSICIDMNRSSFTSVYREHGNYRMHTNNRTFERVILSYSFTSTATSVTVNSSYLFASTLSGLEIWSIWNPCHKHNKSFFPPPSSPQLLQIQSLQDYLPINHSIKALVAMDSFIIALPATNKNIGTHRNFQEISHLTYEFLPINSFEMRFGSQKSRPQIPRTSASPFVLVFEQTPASIAYTYMRNMFYDLSMDDASNEEMLNILLSLFSMYQYRAEVIKNKEVILSCDKLSSKTKKIFESIEIDFYDSLAKQCAKDIADCYLSAEFSPVRVERAALFYAVSSLPIDSVLEKFQNALRMNGRNIIGAREIVLKSITIYLDACLFPSADCALYFENIKKKMDQKLTCLVLKQYGNDNFEQISRLIVDSSLTWQLDDIALCYDSLCSELSQLNRNNVSTIENGQPNSSDILIYTACIVLLLKANFIEQSKWNIEDNHKIIFRNCSVKALQEYVSWMYHASYDSLIHLCVTHKEYLIQPNENRLHNSYSLISLKKSVPFSPSILAIGILNESPDALVHSIFRLLMRNEQFELNSAYGCPIVFDCDITTYLCMLGQTGKNVAEKISSTFQNRKNENVCERCAENLGHELCVVFVLAFIVFQFFKYGSERDTLLYQCIAEEYLKHLIKIELSMEKWTSYPSLSALKSKLVSLFRNVKVSSILNIPLWINEKLSSEHDNIYFNSSPLLAIALKVVSDVDITIESDVIFPITKFQNSNIVVVLLKIMHFQRNQSVIHGIEELIQINQVSLISAYAKQFIKKAEEWKSFVGIVSSQAKSSNVYGKILDEILTLLSGQMNTSELFGIIPQDGDLELFLPYIQNSIAKVNKNS